MGRRGSIYDTSEMLLVRALDIVLLECHLLPNHPPGAAPRYRVLSHSIKAAATPQARHTLCTSPRSAREA